MNKIKLVGGIIASIFLIISIALMISAFWPESTPPPPEISKTLQSTTPTTPSKFPPIPYLILAGGFIIIIYATVQEYRGARKSPEAKAVSLTMAVVAILIISAAIAFLEANYPSWWNNVWASVAGLLSLAIFVMSMLSWYRLPGTGKITLGKSEKFLVAVIMIASFAFFISIATGLKPNFPISPRLLKENVQLLKPKRLRFHCLKLFPPLLHHLPTSTSFAGIKRRDMRDAIRR